MWHSLSKRWYVVLVIAVIAVLVIMAVFGVRLNIAQPFSFLNRIMAPFQVATSGVINFFADIREFSQDLKEFRQSKDYYKVKLGELERELDRMQEIKVENERLRQLLNFPYLEDYETIGADVIGYFPENWTSGVIINRGKRDGVQERDPVITYNGYLAGQVEEVFTTTAHVHLLTHPSFVVGGLIQREASRALGVVRGTPAGKDLYIMDNLSWDADVQSGDMIITSGMSEFFPKGLPIGEVVEVGVSDFGLTQKATIKPFIAGVTLEEILIIIDLQEKKDEGD